jgi:hypothetical protein
MRLNRFLGACPSLRTVVFKASTHTTPPRWVWTVGTTGLKATEGKSATSLWNQEVTELGIEWYVDFGVQVSN